ncbi:hypothetical protein PG994_006659 [Apiospora phragmitis]|uniref:Uncharacterized protein n=1 Tax=Apiospora phragmitis TaxID=2905665 RepID=A0ABR1VFR9_9PEZI
MSSLAVVTTSSSDLPSGSSVPSRRSGPYNKLNGRFYEPLFLLKALGQTRRKHTAVSSDMDGAGLSRRRLLDNLAYLCDLRKGGETTCAVAVEDRPECYKFWLAANGSRVLPEMRNALVAVLEDIRRIISCPEDEKQTRVEALILKCIQFSIKRVWAEKVRLYKSIDECKRKLKSSTSYDDTVLFQWLSRFRGLDCEELCFLVYQERDSNDMKGLERRFNLDDGSPIYQPHLELYRKLRHRLGRLANHVRAVQQVVNDAHNFSFLFSEDGFHVICLLPIPSTPAPQADALLTLPGILMRMGLKGSKFKEYSTAVASMDQSLQIIKNMREEYAKPEPATPRPR